MLLFLGVFVWTMSMCLKMLIHLHVLLLMQSSIAIVISEVLPQDANLRNLRNV